MEVFNFFGADEKVGTTMVCQCLAEALATDYPEESIGIYHLDGNPGVSYSATVKYAPSGMDDLKAAILSKVLTKEELLSACSITNGNLYELKGMCDYSRRKHFTPEAAAYLLSIEAFDLAIVDCGSNFEMPLALGALQLGRNNILVTTQQQTAVEKYMAVKKQIFEPLGVHFATGIVNKYIRELQLADAQRVCQNYEFDQVFTLPFSEYGWQCERDAASLFRFENSLYQKEVHRLVERVAEICGLPIKEGRKKSRLCFWR